jgi:hypothetical protein
MVWSNDVVERIREHLDATGQRHRPVAIIPDALMVAAFGEAAARLEVLGCEPPPGELLLLDGVTKLVSLERASRYLAKYFEICQLAAL